MLQVCASNALRRGTRATSVEFHEPSCAPIRFTAIRCPTTNRSRLRSAISTRPGRRRATTASTATAWRRPACSPHSPNWSRPMARTRWRNSSRAYRRACATANFRCRWRSSNLSARQLRRMGRAQRNPSPRKMVGFASLYPPYDLMATSLPATNAKRLRTGAQRRSNLPIRYAARWIASLRSQ